MPWVAVLVLIPTSILFIVAFLSFRRNGYWKVSNNNKLPPGNMGVPLIGETFSFMKPHSTTTLGPFMGQRISRFGKIFTTNLFGRWTIVSADAELNRFVSRNDTRLFGPGWPLAFDNLFGRGSIPLVVGDTHKHMRSTVLDFLSGEKLRTVFLQDLDHAASLLISSWKEGTVISAKDEATKFSLYIMAKKMLSMMPGMPEIEKLRIEYDSFIRGLGSFPVNLPGTTYWKALQSRENILKIFKEEMEERMGKTGDKNLKADADDFLGWLMKNTNYSPEKIGDFLLSVLFAGHDTISRVISALIYFLQGCPSAIEQLREEHRQVVKLKQQKGESKLTWDDYKTLDFTKCVINETLRLGTASLALKKATEDVKFKGYVIPKGCNVMLHYKAVHLDPSLYEDPERFNPWRWLSSSSTKLTNNFMPFGGGVRLCPGAELARLEMTVFLHHLVLKYDWDLAELDQPMNVPFTEFPKGLPIRVRATSTELGMT